MTEYKIPEEPEGPLWDSFGTVWTKHLVYGRLWSGAGWRMFPWPELVSRFGPLTDTPPVGVGDRIALPDFAKLPKGSLGAPVGSKTVYSSTGSVDRVFVDSMFIQTEEYVKDSGVYVDVLRIGYGLD